MKILLLLLLVPGFLSASEQGSVRIKNVSKEAMVVTSIVLEERVLDPILGIYATRQIPWVHTRHRLFNPGNYIDIYTTSNVVMKIKFSQNYNGTLFSAYREYSVKLFWEQKLIELDGSIIGD